MWEAKIIFRDISKEKPKVTAKGRLALSEPLILLTKNKTIGEGKYFVDIPEQKRVSNFCDENGDILNANQFIGFAYLSDVKVKEVK